MLVKCHICKAEFNKSPSQINKSKSGNHFCSRSCSAQYTNTTSPKRQLKSFFCSKCGDEIPRDSQHCRSTVCTACKANTVRRPTEKQLEALKKGGRKLKPRNCKRCGKDLQRKSYEDDRITCEDCYENRVDWSKVTYAEVKGARKYQKNSRIRALARRAYIKSGRPQKCEKCDYDKHFEVCHIKAIKDHSDDTLVSEINDLSNLLALCPNCHWEMDYGDV